MKIPAWHEFTRTIGGREFSFIRPENPDTLLEDALKTGFNRDEFIPYWVDEWPSAAAAVDLLPTYITDKEGPLLELGSGLGITAVTLAAQGYRIIASDYAVDSCHTTLKNMHRNGLSAPCVSFDWRHPCFLTASFSTIVGADILYEERWVTPVATLLGHLLAPKGQAFIFDPERPYLKNFIRALEKNGLIIKNRTRHRTKENVFVSMLEIERNPRAERLH
ncbi:MAG: class I SAM-dependent methyltransferase [Fibrobacterota bacterium]